MSKLYVNPATLRRARVMNNGVGAVLYGRFGNHYLTEKLPKGMDALQYWHRYLHRLGYRTLAELGW